MEFVLRSNRKIFKIDETTCRKMLQVAEAAKQNTFPKKGGYAAAVLTTKGNIYEGAAYCSDTYTLTMHGEAVALAHANLHGDRDIVAITGPNCHICKQLIWENSLRSGIDIVVVMEEEGKIVQVPISKLMPYPWPEKAMV